MEQPDLRIALFQFDIVWEDKQANFVKIESWLNKKKPEADLVVLPEMFSTGFSMSAKGLAESNSGDTMDRVRKWAKVFGVAFAGSFIAVENSSFYNRAFFITPDGQSFFYDKRHLFSIGSENRVFSAGKEKVIIHYKGWNICLLICYDLRFPVWCRNVDNEYDLLLYVANWPASRISGWNTLLPARAMENLAYVCGVNRVGVDGMNLIYNGHSSLYDMRGNLMGRCENGEGILIVSLSLNSLREFREKFPVWKDADRFHIY